MNELSDIMYDHGSQKRILEGWWGGMTPRELAVKTIRDIERRRALRKEGERQAQAHGIANMHKVQRRIRKYE